MPARRRLWASGASLMAGLALLAGCGHSSHRGSSQGAANPEAASATTAVARVGAMTRSEPAGPNRAHTAGGISSLVATESLVATIGPGGAPASPTPAGPSTSEVPGQWLGAASVLPVIAQQRGWVEVRLAQRPNESVAWVPTRDVSLAADYYHIVINLGTMHLQLYNHGSQVADFPAGIGVQSDPTPTGHFFLAFFARSPSPGYGPFVMVTSAHSNIISDWEESGDAITAIHGPLGSDAAIGTTGAAVSHGCIRLHDADLARLREVPAGTPIDIES